MSIVEVVVFVSFFAFFGDGDVYLLSGNFWRISVSLCFKPDADCGDRGYPWDWALPGGAYGGKRAEYRDGEACAGGGVFVVRVSGVFPCDCQASDDDG